MKLGPKFGELAIRLGAMDRVGVKAVLFAQWAREEVGHPVPRFGDLAVTLPGNVLKHEHKEQVEREMESFPRISYPSTSFFGEHLGRLIEDKRNVAKHIASDRTLIKGRVFIGAGSNAFYFFLALCGQREENRDLEVLTNNVAIASEYSYRDVPHDIISSVHLIGPGAVNRRYALLEPEEPIRVVEEAARRCHVIVMGASVLDPVRGPCALSPGSVDQKRVLIESGRPLVILCDWENLARSGDGRPDPFPECGARSPWVQRLEREDATPGGAGITIVTTLYPGVSNADIEIDKKCDSGPASRFTDRAHRFRGLLGDRFVTLESRASKSELGDFLDRIHRDGY